MFRDWLILMAVLIRFLGMLDQGLGHPVNPPLDNSRPESPVDRLRKCRIHLLQWALEQLRTARRRKTMATARLRVFPHPEEEQEDSAIPSMSIRLSDLYPLLAQAYRDNYTWLRDFEDDELLVSNDLYEVVRAFTNCRPSA
jgi:hypothetical protein